jgi:putative NIF3 family GTP cyclohydrolase 1 type 2
LLNKKIKKVALCGGSGSSLISAAIGAGADIYISGDFKYHEFFEAGNHILIADIGHFESEQFTKDIFYEIITKKMPTFAVQISDINTNPINYL